ncbi:sporulation membrane protein YtaF [Tumebacillus flagellatus]|uniref:Sporulation protein n=1 Tax=Tumebacillus flagellatus TaxID=1157490 RepID=A0A074LPV9_9BACL|nr:sporulation membrane protein YtaF [Tumebacillus flagellatus]KEO84156.1 sporulation protein [Tumebacillus flagellatus]
MTWGTILLLALSSSIDNFGVGVSYGIRGIRIRFFANFIISIIAFCFSEIGIHAGSWMSVVLPGAVSNIAGALVLLVIGLRIILLTLPKKKRQQQPDSTKPRSITGYLESPEKADLDASGEIGFLESLVLGVAVSLNALSNGLGAGLIHLSALEISLSAAVFSFLAIWLGMLLGNKVASLRIGSLNIGQFSTVISGVILLFIAMHALL